MIKVNLETIIEAISNNAKNMTNVNLSTIIKAVSVSNNGISVFNLDYNYNSINFQVLLEKMMKHFPHSCYYDPSIPPQEFIEKTASKFIVLHIDDLRDWCPKSPSDVSTAKTFSMYCSKIFDVAQVNNIRLLVVTHSYKGVFDKNVLTIPSRILYSAYLIVDCLDMKNSIILRVRKSRCPDLLQGEYEYQDISFIRKLKLEKVMKV